jgi:hypothetical protein
MGYEVERGAHGQPEIKGYTREYLDASSPRRQQIEGIHPGNYTVDGLGGELRS